MPPDGTRVAGDAYEEWVVRRGPARGARTATADRVPRTVVAPTTRRSTVDRLVRHAAGLPRAALYLVPLRIFIGLGWLRAGIEKIGDAAWWSGAGVRSFISEHVAGGLALPPVRPLLEGVVTDAAVAVAAVVVLTQLAIGVCILIGWRTIPALFAGVALNVAFLASGSTNPNVFYLLVQWALLVGGAGSLLGLDALRSDSEDAVKLNWSVRTWGITTGVALVGAALLVPFVVEYDPATVIDDPALVLITMALLVAGTAALAALRAMARQLTD